MKIEEPKIGVKIKGEVEVVRQDEYDKYLGMVFYPHSGILFRLTLIPLSSNGGIDRGLE